MTLTSLVSRSPEYRQMVVEAGAATKLIDILPSAISLQMRDHMIALLEAIIDASCLSALETTNVETIMDILSSEVTNKGISILLKIASRSCQVKRTTVHH